MLELLRSYQKMDPAARNIFEVFFLYPGPKALLFHRIANPLYRLGVPFIPRMLTEIGRFITGIDIHPGATIGKNCVFDHAMGVVIGETAIIGDRVLIYQGVTLGGVKHTNEKRHPTIGDDVIVGAGSKVLGNIRLGNKVKIGANSVVLIDVPDGMSAAGVPAKILKEKTPEFKDWHLEYYI